MSAVKLETTMVVETVFETTGSTVVSGSGCKLELPPSIPIRPGDQLVIRVERDDSARNDPEAVKE